ncbi:FtsK/SpoIIIE domain-containing protein [Nocardia niigatensis]|uniref:FtsK/SpoIIIE domain-containing protein n=1 Tax=Nocardia niigatensis TaxID=209249 RepID=UPI0002F11071|nr:FtsK/SpoIIIE domain-containing protein [Nocardia niigatensis]
MSLLSIAQFALPASVGLGFAAYILPGPWHGPEPERLRTAEEITEEAPAVLRPAVAVFADPEQTDAMLTTLKLGHPEHGFPSVQGWEYARHGIDVDLWALSGQTFDDWSNDHTRAQLATYLGVEQVTVTSPAPAWIRLHVRVHDTLADPAALPVLAHNDVDLQAVPIGIREDGQPWTLKILYRQILVAGASDSGKGSVLWSIIAGLGPAVKAGLVDLWLADPKGGMEFGRGENRMWKRFQYSAEGILEMLDEAVKAMQERAACLKEAGVRKFVPSVDDPFNVVIIDEYAVMSAFATREQVEKGMRSIGLLVTQGRAVGWTVIVALQDPSKDTMPNRQYFTSRIGLHMTEEGQNDMVHGRGAKKRGAYCHEIPTTTPGVAYVGVDGSTEFVRVRAFYVRDEDADAIIDAYSPAPEITGPTEDYSGFDPDDLGDEEFGEETGAAA